jgi:ankyrin repeat protein
VVPGPDSDSDELETREQYLGRALLSATQAGNLEVSQYLISEGAEINFLDKHFFGPTPLFNAAEDNNLELVQLLLTSGADPNLHANCERVAIFAATSIDVVQTLVAAGANIHVEDNESRTVLMLVRDVDLLRFFLERGADASLCLPVEKFEGTD